MHGRIKNLIERALELFGVPKEMVPVAVEHTADTAFGDYTSNVAMVLVRSMGASVKNPFELALKITEKIQHEISLTKNTSFEKIEAVKPGFINFFLSKSACVETVEEIHEKKAWYGKNTRLWNKRIIIEHTNLNPFKPVHIGHLVNNAVGESLSRLLEFQDAKLTRASYGGDVGLHVAKTIWGMYKLHDTMPQNGTVREKIDFLGEAYVAGSAAYGDNKDIGTKATSEKISQEISKEEIKIINKKVFDKSDPKINDMYAWGREASVGYFEELYGIFGSRFDYHFYESEVAAEGVTIVKFFLASGVFEESENAIIFPGEKYGLHNRVFITSQGLPTYEAKELGLTKRKFELHDFDESIVVTAHEQDDYFKVIIKALGQIYPEVSRRTKHIAHGMLRFTSGKMSSRKGNVVTADSLVEDIEKMVFDKIRDRDMSDAEKQTIARQVSMAAIKYSILRQSIGKDIVFDPGKSISFEGDSGPYLQYSYVRTQSIIAKALKENIYPNIQGIKTKKENKKDANIKDEETKTEAENPIFLIERLLVRFPEIVERAAADYTPSAIATYLIQLAGEFNSFYAHTKIVDAKDAMSPYKLALTEAIGIVLKNGMYLLGIEAPSKM